MIDATTMTVMITDNSVEMCKSIHHMMNAIGVGRNFVFAHNGKRAWELLQEKPVDLLLLDYNLPEINGAEILRNIRSNRGLRDLPVIMVTAEAYREYVAESGEFEIDAFIVKPLTTLVLEQKIASVVRVANNPPPMVAHLRKAREFQETGNLEGAIAEAELAVKAKPEASKPLRELGYYYFQKNELESSEKCLLNAVEMNELDVFALHYLGELYLRRNDMEKATEYFERAMEINPRHVRRGIDLGKILVSRGMADKATKVFDKITRLPGCSFDMQEEIADFCLVKGGSDYAVKLLESLIAQDKTRWDLFFKLGRLWEKSGEKLKAVACFAQAAALDKNNIDARMRIADIYLSMRKPILAEKALAEVLEINRDHEGAKELIKKCFERA
jgi:DNA-binding response OmpR family regulator